MDDHDSSPERDSLLKALAHASDRPLGEVHDSGTSEPPRIDRALHGLQPGTRAGRFVVGDRIGAGGMGVVYAAQDPELHRKVAIKLMKGGSAERIQREARALAALSHPNVVTVYEVGTCEAGLFIAMELVEGSTLRAWLIAQRRPWREVLAAFVEAGRGLQAAHAAGIVHRDFKPENVLVGADGRVRVTDFGLARAAGPADTPAPTAAPLHTDSRAGTPHYMSPEQHAGGEVDARADQYAFCVSLREALGAGRFPRAVERVLRRGLATDPGARHPSMQALLDALDRALTRRRRVAGWALAGAALAASAVTAWGVARKDPCAGADRALAGVWDAPRKAQVRAAMIASNATLGPDAWTRLESILDRYAAGLVAAHTEACEATRVRGVQSEALLDRRVACLSGWGARLQTLADVLSTSGVPVDKAISAAYALPDVRACADAQTLLSGLPPPENAAAAEKLKEGRAAVARAAALTDLARFKEAKEVAQKALTAATDARYEPLRAEALFQLGDAQVSLRETTDAVRNLEAAALAAEAARHDLIVARARVRQIFVVGYQLADKSARAREQPWADAALKRIGDPADERGRYFQYAAGMEEALDNPQLALTYRQQALALLEKNLGPEHPVIGAVLNGIANDLGELGHRDQGIEYRRRALALQEKAYGPIHPLVATTLMNLGIDLRSLGRYEEALEAGKRAVNLRAQALGPNHADVGMAWNALSNSYDQMGRTREAIEAIENALVVYERGGLKNHLYQAVSEGNLGNLLREEERYAEAEQHHRHALQLFEAGGNKATFSAGKTHLELSIVLLHLSKLADAREEYRQSIGIIQEKRGAEHPEMALAQYGFAGALLDVGQPKEALELHRQALALREKILPPKHHHIGLSHAAVGAALLGLNQPEAALAELEKAGPFIEAAPDAAMDLAVYRFDKARALAGVGSSREARDSAESALKAAAAVPGDSGKFRVRVQGWLGQHPAR